MATRAFTASAEEDRYTAGAWAACEEGDVGAAFDAAGFASVAVQATGTFDTSQLTVQVSNDGTNWATGRDKKGNSAILTAAGLVTLGDLARYVRPSAAGGATTSITCALYAVKWA